MGPSSNSSSDAGDMGAALDAVLLDRYLARECTPGEWRQVIRWMRVNPEEGRCLEHLRAAAKRTVPIEVVPFEMAWDVFATRVGIVRGGSAREGSGRLGKRTLRMELPSGKQSLHGGVPSKRSRSHQWDAHWHTRWLASGIMLFTIGLLLLTTHRLASRKNAVEHVYATSARRSAHITLPDGSSLILAPLSRLTVPSDFGPRSRTLSVTGEAYFVVEPNMQAPFTVHTGGVVTRVLGTTFDVRHYATDPNVRIIVTQGRVVTGPAHRSVTLPAGGIAYATDSSVVSALADDVHQYTQWTHDRLVFRHAPVASMLVDIGRWYGYEFRLTDSVLARQPVTAAFDLADPKSAMLTLRDVLEVDLEVDGTIITLIPKRVVPRAVPLQRHFPESSPMTSTQVGR